eukprot:6250728-Pyramimonas_sp.AAC.1
MCVSDRLVVSQVVPDPLPTLCCRSARWCSRGGVVCGSRRRNFADCVEMGMPPPWQPAGLQASGARARAWHDCWREPE